MRIVVTTHAYQSLLDRLGVRKNNAVKVATKAWNSKEKVDSRETCKQINQPDPIEYRKMLGQIFVFAIKDDCNVLVTVHPPTNGLAKEKHLEKLAMRKFNLKGDMRTFKKINA